MSFAARTAMLPVRFYRRFISKPLHFCFGPWCGCRFSPTCSEYALQALAKYGFFKGSWLAIKRLVRCNPFSAGGVDEVPEK